MSIAELLLNRKQQSRPTYKIDALRVDLPGSHHDTVMEYEGFDPHWGLPDRLREAAIERDLLTAVRIYDALAMSGVRPGDEFTAYGALEWLGAAGIPTSKNRVYEAIQCREFFVLQEQREGRGRPIHWYRLASIQEIMSAFGIHDPDPDTSPMLKEDLGSTAAYRAGLQRGIQARQPEISRAALARRLGVSKATTRHYDRRNGTLVEPQFLYHDLGVYANWQDVFRSFETKKDRRFFLKITPWNGKPPYLAPLQPVIAAVHIHAGDGVTIAEQRPNRYTLGDCHRGLYQTTWQFMAYGW